MDFYLSLVAKPSNARGYLADTAADKTIFGTLICYQPMGSDGKFRGKVSLVNNMSCLVQPCRVISVAKTIDNASWTGEMFSLAGKSCTLGSPIAVIG